jgi:hypothetical protein
MNAEGQQSMPKDSKTANVRHHNGGIRKLCDCGGKKWPQCKHPWHFSYKPRGGERMRFSLDTEYGDHIQSKEDAKKAADATFLRGLRRSAAIAKSSASISSNCSSTTKSYGASTAIRFPPS